jgi:integrase
MRNSTRLTARKVANLTKPGRHHDGGGLSLQIGKSGGKSWLFRYERAGRERWMGLGPITDVTLAEARDKARETRRLLLEGLDPLDARHARRAAARGEGAKGITFKDCAERLIASHERAWKNHKHRQQWANTLAVYCYPTIGNLPVGAVDTGLVLKCLEPIWATKTETASRVRMRIEAVLNWAKARGYRSGDNPALWRGHLDRLMPAPRSIKVVRHHPALPYRDIPAFMAELRAREGMSARALEVTALCTLRTAEVIGARWDEFDLIEKVWTIPASRMKGRRHQRREHRVPLPARVLEILATLPRNGEYVFPGERGGHLSDMAMLELMRGMRPGFVPHGLRSSFKDWASESTHFPRERRLRTRSKARWRPHIAAAICSPSGAR